MNINEFKKMLRKVGWWKRCVDERMRAVMVGCMQ